MLVGGYCSSRSPHSLKPDIHLTHLDTITAVTKCHLCQVIVMEPLPLKSILQSCNGPLPSQQTHLSIITADTKGHLCQVIGTKAEELCSLGQLAGDERTTGHLNHSTDLVVNLGA